MPDPTTPSRRVPAQLAALGLLLLASCTTTGGSDDPLEGTNRAFHALNKGVDQVVLRPVSQIYGAVTPDPVEDMVSNAAANLGAPGDAVNYILQGDFASALKMTGRFAVNSTIGLAGLFDPATELGLLAETTDFGQTLHVWGVKEGAYVELPLLGPSTGRDALGRAVDIVLDPVNALVSAPESDYVLGARILGTVDQRKRLAGVVDELLYNSADSYAASRTAYLEYRRRQLGGEIDAEEFDDPFAFDE